MCLDKAIEFDSSIRVRAVILERGIRGHEGVLTTNVQRIVNSPVNFPHLASRVEETLQSVRQDELRTESDSSSLDRFGDSVDDVW